MAIEPTTALGIGSLVIGGIGSLFGGDDATQTQEIIRRLSPEQMAILEQLQNELDRNPFDVSGIASSTRERIGNETSALRLSAMNRLQRGGVSPLQTESALGDILTRGLRELGGTIANIEFAGQQATEGRRLDIFKILAGITGGTGTTEVTGTSSPPSGLGFGQLFGTGLRSLLQTNQNNPVNPDNPVNPGGSRGNAFFNASLAA